MELIEMKKFLKESFVTRESFYYWTIVYARWYKLTKVEVGFLLS